MHAPQIIMIVLMAFGAARGIIKHGEPDSEVNAWASLAGCAVTTSLLWWGGFFG